MVLWWEYVKKYKKLLLLALFLAAINQTFSLLDPQITRLLIDNYATEVDSLPQNVFLTGVLTLLLGYIGVAFVSRVAKNFQDYYVNSITQRVGTDTYAHRLSTVAHADTIFVIQKGKLVEKGNHASLRKKRGLYYALWREQIAGT